MTTLLWNNWQAEWLLGELVEFDGPARRIYVHPEVSVVSVKEDLYSAWKRWVILQNNAAYAPAFRAIGGDPVGGGQYAGDIYFLMNNWQIVVDHFVRINGIVYSDNPSLSPYLILPGGGVYATVSSLAQSIETAVPVVTGDVSAFPAAIANVVAATDQMVAAVTPLSAAVNAQSNAVTAIDGRTATIANSVQDLGTAWTGMDAKVDALGDAWSEMDGKMDAFQANAMQEFDTLRTMAEDTHAAVEAMDQAAGLTPSQETMILEMYALMGLDPTKPLIVNQSMRRAGSDVRQTISVNPTNKTTTITRQP